jgi:paraquat-inducible protein B
MADFGWSASCLVEAIKLTNTARKALKDAGGATSQYEDAASFLTSLKSTLDLLKQHLDKLPNESHVTAIKNHLREIDAPWADFKSTLEKYEKSLSAESTKSKTKQAPRKIQWAAKGVDEAVRKLRERVMQPIQAINCALTLSILYV